MKKFLLLILVSVILKTYVSGQFASDTVSQSLKMAYTQLANAQMYSVNYWLLGDDRSDIAVTGGDFLNEVPDFDSIMFNNTTKYNSRTKQYWYRGFTIIYYCNYVVENIDISGLDANEKKRIVAEAKFLRALMYFNLSNAFDSLPIHIDVFDWTINSWSLDYADDNTIEGPFNNMSEVYEQIKSDLKSAIINLPSRVALDYNNRFRATKDAARALLGKVYLFESSFAKNYPGDERFDGMSINWDSAFIYCDSVINSGEYSLVGINGETYETWWDNSPLYSGNTPGFRYIFTVDGNGSEEIVFTAINMTPGQIYSSYGGNWIVIWTTARYVSSSSHNTYNFGWGLNLPTQTLINLYAAETGNPKDDPRFVVTVGLKGDSILTTAFGTESWYEIDFKYDYPYSACRKYECTADEYWSVMSHSIDGPIDVPVIRLSDVYLMAAEAAFEQGNLVKALEYMNFVRTRARNSGNSGYPHNLAVVTLDDIRNERALELALEGHRFYDLVRWGITADSIDGRCITLDCANTVEFEEGIDEFVPIPAGAIKINDPDTIPENTRNSNNNKFSIYPNPASDYMMVRTEISDAQIAIFDLQGRKVITTKLEKENQMIDISKLSTGIYTIQFRNQGINTQMKLIKN